MTILALTGGVGGAKLSLGLAEVLAPDEIVFAVNVGDDFEHLGLRISPDLDTLTYTLAGKVSSEHGWGREQESWACMAELEVLGGSTWFRLGDRDLALHLYRTERLQQGAILSEITKTVCERLGVKHRVVPVTDDELRTHVETEQGLLSFQDYFVRRQCEPAVKAIHYCQPTPARLSDAIDLATIDGIVICPSNPFLSVDPLLAVGELAVFMKNRDCPVVAVSPIVGDRALKGPTAKMMDELDMPTTCTRVAEHYMDYVDGFVLDPQDAHHKSDIERIGMRVAVTPSIMSSLQDKIALATACIEFLDELK